MDSRAVERVRARYPKMRVDPLLAKAYYAGVQVSDTVIVVAQSIDGRLLVNFDGMIDLVPASDERYAQYLAAYEQGPFVSIDG